MRAFQAAWLWLMAVSWLGCSSVTPFHQQWEAAEAECLEPEQDECVTLLCGEDACGFYRCEDMPGEVELARFPPARPPAAAAAPGSGPRRTWGSSMRLPNGAEPVMVFPWYGEAKPAPPSRQLPSGRFEKHHIFPQEPELATWFEQQGVKIHSYTIPIPRDVHYRIHSVGGRGGEWNKAWRDFRKSHPGASPEQIFKYAGELIYRFQLLGGPIQPYHSRT